MHEATYSRSHATRDSQQKSFYDMIVKIVCFVTMIATNTKIFEAFICVILITYETDSW
jgi:hypothetical protein